MLFTLDFNKFKFQSSFLEVNTIKDFDKKQMRPWSEAIYFETIISGLPIIEKVTFPFFKLWFGSNEFLSIILCKDQVDLYRSFKKLHMDVLVN